MIPRSKTVDQLRREKFFVFFNPLPNTGNTQADKAQLRLAFDRHLDRFFDGIRQPEQQLRQGPETY